jgi:hypothetical protein
VPSNFTFSRLINWCSSFDMSTWNSIISMSSQSVLNSKCDLLFYIAKATAVSSKLQPTHKTK